MENSYNPLVIFDDVSPEVLGVHGVAGAQWPQQRQSTSRSRSILGTAQSIFRRARGRRLHSPVSVVGLEGASTRAGFTILGADDDKTGLPIFDDLNSRFAAALPAPKLVRLDDAASYVDFRKQRRQPYLDLLAQRLSALEAAFADHVDDDGDRFDALQDDLDDLVARLDRHVSDGHGGQSKVEKAGDAVVGAIAAARTGGQPISLPLPKWAVGHVGCWQDGSEVACTVRVLGADGRPRYATAGAPLARDAFTVLGCAMELGAEVDEICAIVPALSPVVCGERLFQEICGSAKELVRCAGLGTFVGALVPLAVPKVAATMALLQRAQRGDRCAGAEARALHELKGDMVADAAERLVVGQSLKGGAR